MYKLDGIPNQWINMRYLKDGTRTTWIAIKKTKQKKLGLHLTTYMEINYRWNKDLTIMKL